MKGKKFLFIFVLAVVLFVGWMICIRQASGTEEENEQAALVEQADEYLGKKLYVRAIPVLEEALEIQTNHNVSIQKELLTAYRDYGDMDSYYELVQTLDQNNNATAEDYLTMAEYDLEMENVSAALEVAKEGLQKHESDALNELYETYRYSYTLTQTAYEDILPTADSTYMPILSDGAWSYADSDGRLLLSIQAEQATRFCEDGKAVVKQDGRYCVILQNGDLYAVDETGVEEVLGIVGQYILAKKDGLYGFYDYDFNLLSEDCRYEEMTAFGCGVSAVKKDGKWALITENASEITDYIYEDVAVNSMGQAFAGDRAMVKTEDGWILIDTEGNALSEETYTVAKAPESDGYIAVANEEEKWGFIDAEGSLQIDFQYWDAYSFSCDVAAVQVVNEWGYISCQNKLVIEDAYDTALPFQEGYAVAKTAEGMCVLKLRYFDMDE